MEKLNKIFAVIFGVCGITEVFVCLHTGDIFFLALGVILTVLAALIWSFRNEDIE